jgi:hypothetical protein
VTALNGAELEIEVAARPALDASHGMGPAAPHKPWPNRGTIVELSKVDCASRRKRTCIWRRRPRASTPPSSSTAARRRDQVPADANVGQRGATVASSLYSLDQRPVFSGRNRTAARHPLPRFYGTGV